MTWFTASDLGLLFGWSPAYVYKLAHVHDWRRTSTRPVRYHSEDVLDYRATSRERKDLTSSRGLG